MNVRNIIRTFAVVAISSVAMTSCNDFLDQMPDNRAELDSVAKINAILTSAYPTTSHAWITEMYSDNVDQEANPTYTPFLKLDEEAALWKDITYFEDGGDDPNSLWNACYMAAAHANHAIEAIEKLGMEDEMPGQMGEALMCRAYAHWILVNVFAKAYSPITSTQDLGITYMKHAETELKPEYSRGTVAETYDAIAADIEKALPLMDDGHLKIAKYHFNRKAAYAFAARFFLQYTQPDKSNYDKVIKYADVALNGSASSAIRDWATVGAKAINGGVRAMAFTDAADNANLLLVSTYSQWPVCYGPYGIGYKYCHDQIIANNETCANTPWGSKSNFNFTIPQYSGMPKIIMAKNNYYFEYTDPVNNIGFAHMIYAAFTTDEVVLNRAEAYVMKGEYDLAADDLNAWGAKFYKGSGASAKTSDQIATFYENLKYYTPTEPTPKKALNPDYEIEAGKQENMIHAVLAARRLLLLHEGLRLFDVKRFGIEMTRRSILNNQVDKILDTMTKDDPRRAIQLPQNVIGAGFEPNPR